MSVRRPERYRLPTRIRNRIGTVFELSATAASRAPDEFEPVLIHGSVRDAWSLNQFHQPRRYRWAWLAIGGRVYDSGIDLNLPGEMYERQFDVIEIARYSKPEALEMIRRTGSTGPWDARMIDLPNYWQVEPRP